MNSKHIDAMTFEQALQRLTQLVQKLESGQLPLAESVAAFEEGVLLTRHCEKLLDDAEQTLHKLGDHNQAVAGE
ncbi:MAG: exodeoxyribonuclease VII small subunit [Zetaproteobacteria bacterium]|nr:MAG: exodeoxyribonuclease VII small subunit [Zetaproteobacteria bacterium]